MEFLWRKKTNKGVWTMIFFDLGLVFELEKMILAGTQHVLFYQCEVRFLKELKKQNYLLDAHLIL